MNKTELDEIIRNHALWASGQGGARADLRDRYLSGADLHNVNLSRSDLNRANLSDANLVRADLSLADLIGAGLRGASLARADLSLASLIRADLYGANLSGADLSYANLSNANLSNANLSGSIGGPAYYSVSWSGHGERGRRLHAVEQDGRLVFSCGCFSGTEKDLRKYIEEGDGIYRESRLRALEIILELHEGTK